MTRKKSGVKSETQATGPARPGVSGRLVSLKDDYLEISHTQIAVQITDVNEKLGTRRRGIGVDE
jgi:hypothetical protein